MGPLASSSESYIDFEFESLSNGFRRRGLISLSGTREEFTREMDSLFAAVADSLGNFSERSFGRLLRQFQDHGEIYAGNHFDAAIAKEH